MPSKRAEAQQFRETRNVLPEEHKAVIERQIKVIEACRDRILRALRRGAEIPSRVQRSLTHIGIPEGDGLVEELTAITDTDGGARAEKATKIIDSKLETLRGQLEALGGSTREQTVRVLRDLDLEHYWFGEAFNNTEAVIFREHMFRELPVPPRRLKALDIGIGVGRASQLALIAMRAEHGDRGCAPLARNLYGFDLMSHFVEASRKKLAGFGVPPKNIIEGDFLDFPPRLRRLKFHRIWANMHTLWHCTTEAQLRRVLRNIEEVMAEGALLMFDTVGLYHHQGTPVPKRVRQFDDIANFYDVLVRQYAEGNMEPLPEGMSFPPNRFPICDATARTGFYTREILSEEYVDYILEKNKSRLRRRLGGGPLRRFNKLFNATQARELGWQWIRENNLEEWLRREIAYRLPKIAQDPNTVKPLYALPKAERGAQVLDTASTEVDAIINKLAERMVLGYVQKYYIYELTSGEHRGRVPRDLDLI